MILLSEKQKVDIQPPLKKKKPQAQPAHLRTVCCAREREALVSYSLQRIHLW